MKIVKENLEEIQRIQTRLIRLEKLIGLDVATIKDINRRMSIGEARSRQPRRIWSRQT